MHKFFNDLLTENNDTTFCPFRVAGFTLTSLGVPTFIGGAAMDIMHGTFSLVQFGQGFGLMMAGVAVLAGGVAIKAKTDVS